MLPQELERLCVALPLKLGVVFTEVRERLPDALGRKDDLRLLPELPLLDLLPPDLVVFMDCFAIVVYSPSAISASKRLISSKISLRLPCQNSGVRMSMPKRPARVAASAMPVAVNSAS